MCAARGRSVGRICLAGAPGPDVRLIGHDDGREAGILEPADRLRDARQEAKILDRGGSYRTAVPLHVGIDDAIPIEEDRIR